MKNYYEILGLHEHASASEIKKAYRKLAQKYHPDVNSDPSCTEKFKEINEAYGILSDDHKRAQYETNRNLTSGWGVFDHLFGSDSAFSHIFNQRREPPRDDPTVSIKIKLSELESNELNKKIRIRREITCKGCDGKGGDVVKECLYCDGSGNITATQNYGAMKMQTTNSCPMCYGRGKLISGMCSSCQGVGKVEDVCMYDLKITKNLSK